ncbi:MAG: electron transport complex subunit E [Chitinispirillales bacterium]|jgi:electron transport complex protein RnfE|nr:electron transport complex subunit E [Chitinispirillales bacterium]
MLKEEVKRGVITENPILILALGLCPSLAVSTSVTNGLGMGLATMFVLVCSNIIISIIKGWVPDKVRIPCFIMVSAAFVSILHLFIKAYMPLLDQRLGIFIPLITVNCIILGRAEAFASKNSLSRSFTDGIVMGLGFTVSLLILSAIREFLGSNKLFDLMVIPKFQPLTAFALAPGGFFTIAFVMGVVSFLRSRKEARA